MSEPVTVWFWPDGSDPLALRRDARPFGDPKWQEHRALPVAEYDALVRERAVLREALEYVKPLLALLPDELGAVREGRAKARAALENRS